MFESASMGNIGAGHTLGRYELLMPVASGGMAMVWAARLKGTRGFQKTVAVKTIRTDMSEDPLFEQMFLDEASLAEPIEMRYPGGGFHTSPTWIVLHMATHGFHHKGQIAAMCRLLGHPLPDLDLDVSP